MRGTRAGARELSVSEETVLRQLSGALQALAPLIAAHAHESNVHAALSPAIARGLIQAGLFRLWIPRAYGGHELSLAGALSIYETAGALDGSVGWAVMIGAGAGLFAAYLEPAAARELFGPPDAVIAGSGAADGTAERVRGGYRASGRWRYASGADYATTFTANCIVTQGGLPVHDAQGQRLVRAMAFPRAHVRVHRTWRVSGMRGTGSHDMEVAEAFVPEAHTFSVFTDSPREPGALYRLPFGVLTELPVTAVALGIAAHALEEFTAVDAVSVTARGDTAALLQQARASVAALTRLAWNRGIHAELLEAGELARISTGCALIVQRLRRSVAELAHLAGMAGIREDEPLSRATRDLTALAAHGSVSARRLPEDGKQLL